MIDYEFYALAFGFLIGFALGLFLPDLISLPKDRICTTKTDEQDRNK